MYDLTILSIFKNSSPYVDRYAQQVLSAFRINGGKCHAIWLEGDSSDDTFEKLKGWGEKLSSSSINVTLLKHDTPYKNFVNAQGNNPGRWVRIADAWNTCIGNLEPSKVTVCVESDLIWKPETVNYLSLMLTEDVPVLYPMMYHLGVKDSFYDTHGFTRRGKDFNRLPPYWDKNDSMYEDDTLLEITTGGGMIVTSSEIQKNGRFGSHDCIMHYPENVKLHMAKKCEIYHPFDSFSYPTYINSLPIEIRSRFVKYNPYQLTDEYMKATNGAVGDFYPFYITKESKYIYFGETTEKTHGLGDGVLLTALARELNKTYPNQKLIVRTTSPKEPFYNNPRIYKIEHGICGPEYGVNNYGLTEEQIGPDGCFHLNVLGKKMKSTSQHHIAFKCAYFGINDPDITPELFVTEQETAGAKKLLQDLSPDKPSILLCRNSSEPRRDWNQEGWIKVVEKLNERYSVFQVEQKYQLDWKTKEIKRTLEAVPNARQELRGVDIRTMIALASVCKKYLGVNTGMMPIATAFGNDNIIYADNTCGGDSAWLFPKNTHIWNYYSLKQILHIVEKQWMKS